MSISATELTTKVFASKEMQKEALERHGHKGWRKTKNSDGTEILEELVFIRSLKLNEAGWVPIETHRKNIATRKEANKRHFMINPGLLQEKKRRKRLRDEGIVLAHGWDEHAIV